MPPEKADLPEGSISPSAAIGFIEETVMGYKKKSFHSVTSKCVNPNVTIRKHSP
jgi:hypothetical protein